MIAEHWFVQFQKSWARTLMDNVAEVHTSEAIKNLIHRLYPSSVDENQSRLGLGRVRPFDPVYQCFDALFAAARSVSARRLRCQQVSFASAQSGRSLPKLIVATRLPGMPRRI